jgi:hypothetical protein
MELNENYIKHAVVVPNILPNTTATTASQLNANEVAILETGKTTFTTLGTILSAGTKFSIYKKFSDGSIMKTPELTFGSYTGKSVVNVLGTEQVSYIGYNGTSGSLPSTLALGLWLTIIMENGQNVADRNRGRRMHADFTVKTAGNQLLVAEGLVNQLNKNFARFAETNKEIKFGVVCDEAGVTPTGTTTTFIATNGSKSVAINGTLTNVPVGSYIRLEGTATTNGIYKVVAYTASNSIVLDRAFNGTSATFAIANTVVVTAAAAALAECGIKMEGTQNEFNTATRRSFYMNRFSVQLNSDFGSTVVTTATHATKEVGAWQDAAMDEYTTLGNEGQDAQTLGTPPLTRTNSGNLTGKSYAMYNIPWTEDASQMVSHATLKGDLIFYLEVSAAGELVDANQGHLLYETLIGAAITTAMDRV